jgi:hypothetical protein
MGTVKTFFDSKENLLIMFWLFSGIMDSMPPIPPNASWPLVWLHNTFQFIGANLGNISRRPTQVMLSTTTEQTPTASSKVETLTTTK